MSWIGRNQLLLLWEMNICKYLVYVHMFLAFYDLIVHCICIWYCEVPC